MGIFFHPTDVLGQRNTMPVPDAEFGQIPDSLYSMNEYALQPDAPFIYTVKELEVNFENDENAIVALLDYYVRIKVFDASAREASVVAIPYYFERDIEEVVNIRAATHTQEGEEVPLPDDSIRRININSRYNVIEFTMPQVEDGAILEYSYRVKRRYIEELPDFYLANQAPTDLAKVTITYPGYLRYETIEENFDGQVNRFTQQIDTSSAAKIFTVPQPDPILKETYVARDIPALEEEAYISSIDDYRGKLKFKLSEFGIPRQKLENSWKLVVAELRRNQNVLAVADRNTKAKALGREIARLYESEKAVQDSIFRYINSTANFSGSKSPYSEVTDSTVLTGEPSNQAAINQTLLAMLHGAGIEAYPLLISTRQFGQINKSFPSFFQFNGQLTYSIIDGETYFMDASFPYSQPNLIPVDTYNETGLLLKPDGYEWKDIVPAKSLFAIDIRVNARLDREGNLSGDIHAESSGYPAQVVRQRYSNGQPVQEIFRRAVFDGYTNAGISNLQFKNYWSFEEPITFDSDFELESYATSFTDGLQYRPMIVGYLMSNPFNEPSRELPVTLDAPEKLDLVYEIEIPSGYSIQQGSQNRTIELPGASLTESYNFEGRTLRYEFHIDISRKQFEPELYPQLLNLYERWVELSNSSWRIRR
ncbi:DUF3857 domain-containing protein [Balneolaceae bacterium YR4-1]|uniref:DUF3857 domain-containing protein n=1 Tax=Halalkalibaculum roseum TaxID=2709311 RepID=A0A6M1T5A5_9BACT|nr:DUF3857 domain-containing protein [Halalkalibaculum roseum]